MTIAWVLGGGGLLGSAIRRTLQKNKIELFTQPVAFNWNSEFILADQLRQLVKNFFLLINEENDWQIYWAAGIGNLSSSENELAIETKALELLIKFLKIELELNNSRGCFILASSAGAIYAGVSVKLINENTPIAPTTIYAYEKIKQEDMIKEFAFLFNKVSALILRISTLYGPGQSFGKRQGLISLMARRMLVNQPIQIFVPLDTIRDYIFSDEAADLIIATVHLIAGHSGTFLKIVASEEPTTIATIISNFRKISRHSPRVISSTNNSSYIYSRQMQFRSIIYPVRDKISRTILLVGIARVFAYEKTAYIRSK